MAAKRNTNGRQRTAARLEARDVAAILSAGTSELKHQMAVVGYLEQLGAVYCHVPNGGRRGRIEGANLKRAGAKPGVPDLLVFGVLGRKLPRVAIEMKSDDGRVTPEQRWWADMLSALGWTVGVAWSAGQAIDLLRGEGYR